MYSSTSCTDITDETEETHDSVNTLGHCFKLPGKKLNLSAPLCAKKFQYHGYKTGALTAFAELELAGIGILNTKKNKLWEGENSNRHTLIILVSQTSLYLLHSKAVDRKKH